MGCLATAIVMAVVLEDKLLADVFACLITGY